EMGGRGEGGGGRGGEGGGGGRRRRGFSRSRRGPRGQRAQTSRGPGADGTKKTPPMPRITSRDNPRLKEAARLIGSSRDRHKAGRCVLEGAHVIAAYRERYGAPETLIIAESSLAEPAVRVLRAGLPESRTLVVNEA